MIMLFFGILLYTHSQTYTYTHSDIQIHAHTHTVPNTHSTKQLMAIDKNNVDRVHEILSKHMHNKAKAKELCLADVRRLPGSEVTECPLLTAASSEDPAVLLCMIEKHDVSYA